MSTFDYLRLGTANILGHKKRCFTVIIIISAMISILTAGALVIQGTENAVLAENNRLTNGKVLLQTALNTSYCQADDQDCDLDHKIASSKALIAQYGGEILNVPSYRDQFTTLSALPTNILNSSITDELKSLPNDTLPLIISARQAATWMQISLPMSEQMPNQKVATVEKIRSATLHQTITNKQTTTASRDFFVLDLSPSSVGASSLNLSAVRQDDSPFNIILSSISTGSSQTFLVDSPAIRKQLGDPVATPESIWALFPDSESAAKYSENSAFYCDDYLQFRGKCPTSYLGEVIPAFGNPIWPVSSFKNIHTIYRIVCIALMAIAVIIILSTFSRLIAKDTKVISLYHALGASKGQICLIYCTYLFSVSFLASFFALFIGALLTLILNLCNATALSQIFTLAFGSEYHSIILLGWNPAILYMVATLFITSIITILINYYQFSSKKLAQKLK